MKINVRNFKNLLKKATIDYLVPSISLNIENNKIWASSISPDQNAIVFLNLPNDIIDKTDEHHEFNFQDIGSNVKPYIDLLKDELVDLQIGENKILLKDSTKKKINLFFCTVEFTNHFQGEDKSEKYDYFYETQMSKDFLSRFNELKKVAVKFGKIYIVCKDGKLYIESTDKTNSFSNSVSLETDDVNPELDFSMCFDFRNLSYILNTIEDNIENFKMKCTYLEEYEAGMILFENGNEEKYFITSKNE